MLEILLLPLRMLFWLILLPFRLILALSVGVALIIGGVFAVVGTILVFTVVGIIPGALLGLFGLALIAFARRR